MQHVNVILTEHTHTHTLVCSRSSMPVELGTCATGDDAKALPSCLYPEKRKRKRKGEAFFYRRVVSKEMLSLSLSSTLAYAVALE